MDGGGGGEREGEGEIRSKAKRKKKENEEKRGFPRSQAFACPRAPDSLTILGLSLFSTISCFYSAGITIDAFSLLTRGLLLLHCQDAVDKPSLVLWSLDGYVTPFACALHSSDQPRGTFLPWTISTFMSPTRSNTVVAADNLCDCCTHLPDRPEKGARREKNTTEPSSHYAVDRGTETVKLLQIAEHLPVQPTLRLGCSGWDLRCLGVIRKYARGELASTME